MKKITSFKTINLSLKYNLLVGLSLGIWLFLFLFLVRPFKQDNLSLGHLARIATGMALIVIINYSIISIVQRFIYTTSKKWSIQFEILIILFFSLLLLITSFIYYKSDLSNGSYRFVKFLSKDFIPTIIIILPFLVFLRKYIVKFTPKKSEFLNISGENKFDFLKIKKEELVCISSAQNYVEVFYLKNNDLKKKLIRTTLKKIEKELPFLVKVHRSHLINKKHFISFKDKKTLELTRIEVPFSKKYKTDFFNKNSSLKTIIPSQSSIF